MHEIVAMLGWFGVLAAMVLGFLMLFILPWVAIVECVRADMGRNTKAVLIVLMVLTWGLGNLVYGVFFTRSRGLRLFTLASIGVPLLILVPSAVMAVKSGRVLAARHQSNERAEMQRLIDRFDPAIAAPDAVAPFLAVRFDPGTGARPTAPAISRFSVAGADLQTARPIDDTVRRIAADPANERFFALTRMDFGAITPSSGGFSKIDVDTAAGDFSWPKGLTWDASTDSVVIVTSHVYTEFFRYSPQTYDWQRLPGRHRDTSIVGLAWEGETQLFHALEDTFRDRRLSRLHRFNGEGARLGSVNLSPAIPVQPSHAGFVQLHASSGKLVIVLPDAIYVVDPATGAVSAPADQAIAAVRDGFWPHR